MNDSTKNDNSQGSQRAAYQPPEVVRVSLRPEEAVLGHCKTATSTGPASHSCTTLHCRTFGS
jgi:hypothetical protein